MLKNIKLKIKTFFKQLICNHKYSYVGMIPYFYYYDEARTKKCNCFVDFFECEYCNKRKFIATDEKHVYGCRIWKELKMWEKHEIEIDYISKEEAQN